MKEHLNNHPLRSRKEVYETVLQGTFRGKWYKKTRRVNLDYIHMLLGIPIEEQESLWRKNSTEANKYYQERYDIVRKEILTSLATQEILPFTTIAPFTPLEGMQAKIAPTSHDIYALSAGSTTIAALQTAEKKENQESTAQTTSVAQRSTFSTVIKRIEQASIQTPKKPEEIVAVPSLLSKNDNKGKNGDDEKKSLIKPFGIGVSAPHLQAISAGSAWQSLITSPAALLSKTLPRTISALPINSTVIDSVPRDLTQSSSHSDSFCQNREESHYKAELKNPR